MSGSSDGTGENLGSRNDVISRPARDGEDPHRPIAGGSHDGVDAAAESTEAVARPRWRGTSQPPRPVDAQKLDVDEDDVGGQAVHRRDGGPAAATPPTTSNPEG
jgi:hypothetical protein